ncbi:MAG: hypothetical protein EOP87_20155 [Verrucomicrobiaceae bacterium]|nr:MAG: hypothetical protein EOP87_20155 [Verrucomicrobiaceae bacterium]
MKPKPIFLIPPLVMLVLCGLLASFPGDRIGFIFIASMTCILPIGFSDGWTKYAGMALWILFLADGLYDVGEGQQYHREQERQAIEHERRRWEREKSGKGKENASEQ